MDKVPSPDPGSENSNYAQELERKFSELDFRILESDAKARDNLNREADQRLSLRFWSVIIASLLIFLLLIVLFWIVVDLQFFAKSGAAPVFLVALFVAPIAAMTTLAVSLLFAAFRGSKDGDDKMVGEVAIDGARASGFLS